MSCRLSEGRCSCAERRPGSPASRALVADRALACGYHAGQTGALGVDGSPVVAQRRQVVQWGVLPVDEHSVAHHYGGPVVEDDLVVPQRTPACTQSNIRMPYRVLGDSSRANAGVLDRRVRRQREGEVHCWYWHSCEGLLVSCRLAVAMMANMSRQPSCPCSSH